MSTLCQPCICTLPIITSIPNHSIRDVIFITAETFNISIADIKSESRKRIFVEPRMMAMLWLRDQGHKVVSIGAFMRRDHSTVCVSTRTIANYIQTDSILKVQWDLLKSNLSRTDFIIEKAV